MPCTICKNDGCRADVCDSDIINESYRELDRMLTETVEYYVYNLSLWSPLRVSHIGYPPSATVYQGEPNEIRRKICSMREAYLVQNVKKSIKRNLQGVVSIWSVGLFKRVLTRLQGGFQTNCFEQYNRLLVDSRLVSPKTVTDYKAYIIGLAMFMLRKRLPDNFLDLSDVPDADLIPAQIVYRDRVVYKEIQVQSKITMEMCSQDEKYLTDDNCPICMDETHANNMVAFTCGHAFCCDCSAESIQKCGRKCPMCRAETNHIKFKSDILPDKFNILMSLVR